MFTGKCTIMATGGTVVEDNTPPSILIDLNQSQVKEPHHCKFEDCTRPRRGYNDFCRQHRAIGKIISGKIARAKAIAEIDARDKSNEVTEVNRTGSEDITDRVVVKSFWADIWVMLGIELGFYLLILLFMLPILILV